MIRPADLIEKKRNGEEHTDEELSELVVGYTRGDVPDYQMAAWCMAVYFKGLTGRETHALTDAMIRSGETLDLGAALGRRVVDKHSTGGVGDKTSLAVGPIVAACGVPFAKMSGRGLGHTGGTLDKLESIPGFRVELTIDEFVDQVRDIGLAIIGQTGDLVPADGKLYALRDVTGTIDIVPLIASSIMSKKLAAGADAIVLDVKVGDGAFMKTLDDARILAEQMVDLGRRAGREVVCLLTDMDQPLGAAVGNALEIREAAETVAGEGPPDLTELVLEACARLLVLSDLGSRARRRAESVLADAMTSGSARERYERWIRAQGGDPDLAALPMAPVIREVTAPARWCRHPAWLPSRSASRPSSSEAAAGRRTTRSTTPSASCAVRSAGRRSRRGRCSRTSTPATRTSAARAAEAVLAAYEIGDADAPHRARDPARRRRVAAMPELPEVETIRAQLAPRLEGRTLARVEILDPRLTRPVDLFEVAEELEGDRVVARRAARQVPRAAARERLRAPRPPADDGELRLRSRRATSAPSLELDDGTRLAYRDVRRFGTWLVLEDAELEPYLAKKNGAGAARLALHRALARGAARRTASAAEGRSPRSARRRGPREHLRRRGALARPPEPAPAGAISSRRARSVRLMRAIRAALRTGIDAPGLDPEHVREARRLVGLHAGRVPRLRARRRAVPTLSTRRSRRRESAGAERGSARAASRVSRLVAASASRSRAATRCAASS